MQFNEAVYLPDRPAHCIFAALSARELLRCASVAAEWRNRVRDAASRREALSSSGRLHCSVECVASREDLILLRGPLLAKYPAGDCAKDTWAMLVLLGDDAGAPCRIVAAGERLAGVTCGRDFTLFWTEGGSALVAATGKGISRECSLWLPARLALHDRVVAASAGGSGGALLAVRHPEKAAMGLRVWELGTGSTAWGSAAGSRELSGLRDFMVAAVTCGKSSDYALDGDGVLLSWSCGRRDELVHFTGAGGCRPAPVKCYRLPGGKAATRISARAECVLALSEDGQVYALGRGRFGECGPSLSCHEQQHDHSHLHNQRQQQKAGEAGWVAIAMPEGVRRVKQIGGGRHHCLAVSTDGSLLAWGRNDRGQCGLGEWRSAAPILSPSPVLALRARVAAVSDSCFAHHSLALYVNGRLFAFGASNHGGLGVGLRVLRAASSCVQHSPIAVDYAFRHRKGSSVVAFGAGDGYSALATCQSAS